MVSDFNQAVCNAKKMEGAFILTGSTSPRTQGRRHVVKSLNFKELLQKVLENIARHDQVMKCVINLTTAYPLNTSYDINTQCATYSHYGRDLRMVLDLDVRVLQDGSALQDGFLVGDTDLWQSDRVPGDGEVLCIGGGVLVGTRVWGGHWRRRWWGMGVPSCPPPSPPPWLLPRNSVPEKSVYSCEALHMKESGEYKKYI